MLENLDRLKVFYFVFSKKSIMEAANILHVSQSAVSQSIRKLENEIKSPLFTRLHKRLIPTTAGDRLFDVVHPFMKDLDTCLNTLEQARNKPFGKLGIGAPLEFGKQYLPRIAALFREQYPEVTFYLKFGDPGTLLPLVETGKIDFALVDIFLTQNQFSGSLGLYDFKPVIDEEVILACSRQYDEQKIKNDHSFNGLIKQDFIAYRPEALTIKNWFKHHFDRYNIQARVVLTVDSHQGVISAIKHHAGLGVIASHMVDDEIKQGIIIPINPAKPAIINQISLAILNDKIPTLAEKVFIKFLLDKIQNMRI